MQICTDIDGLAVHAHPPPHFGVTREVRALLSRAGTWWQAAAKARARAERYAALAQPLEGVLKPHQEAALRRSAYWGAVGARYSLAAIGFRAEALAISGGGEAGES